MTPLRAKYIRDLVIHGRSKHTQEAYTRYVCDLARYYRRSPELISYEEVTGWLFHLIKERQLSASLVRLIAPIRVTGLVDLQALLAFVFGNQLDLSVGEAFGRQVGEHLMAEQVRGQRLRKWEELLEAMPMGRRPPGGI
jgi:Phage integrase, N-terminal SAM-like domain